MRDNRSYVLESLKAEGYEFTITPSSYRVFYRGEFVACGGNTGCNDVGKYRELAIVAAESHLRQIEKIL